MGFLPPLVNTKPSTFLVFNPFSHTSITKETPLQQFNATIARLSESIECQQQELANFKRKIENMTSWDKEVDIRKWYAQL